MASRADGGRPSDGTGRSHSVGSGLKANLPPLPLNTVTDPKELAHAVKLKQQHNSKASQRSSMRSVVSQGGQVSGKENYGDNMDSAVAKRRKLMAILARERQKHEQKKMGMKTLMLEKQVAESKVAEALDTDLSRMIKKSARRPQTMHSSSRQRIQSRQSARPDDDIVKRLQHLTSDIKDLSSTVPGLSQRAKSRGSGVGRSSGNKDDPQVWQTLYRYEAELQDELEKKEQAEKKMQQLQFRHQLDQQVKEREINKLRLLEEEKYWAEQEFIQLEVMKKKDQDERERRKMNERENRDAIVKDRLLRKQKVLEEKIKKRKEEKRQVKKYLKELEEAKRLEETRKERGREEAKKLVQELAVQREAKLRIKEDEKVQDLAKHEEYLSMLEKQDAARKRARDEFLDRQKRLYVMAMDKAPDWAALAEEDARKAKKAYDELVAKQDAEMEQRLKKADLDNKAFREALAVQKREREREAQELKEEEEKQAMKLMMVAKEAAAKEVKKELAKKEKTIDHYKQLQEQILEKTRVKNADKIRDEQGLLTDLEKTLNRPLLDKAKKLHEAKDKLDKLEKLDELHSSLNDVWGRFFKVASREGTRGSQG